MGNTKMKNLEEDNILFDNGIVPVDVICCIESLFQLKLPVQYINFITSHNGADILARIFDYDDPNRSNRKNGDSISFINAEKILYKIELIGNSA
jgi:hypothetical protein